MLQLSQNKGRHRCFKGFQKRMANQVLSLLIYLTQLEINALHPNHQNLLHQCRDGFIVKLLFTICNTFYFNQNVKMKTKCIAVITFETRATICTSVTVKCHVTTCGHILKHSKIQHTCKIKGKNHFTILVYTFKPKQLRWQQMC